MENIKKLIPIFAFILLLTACGGKPTGSEASGVSNVSESVSGGGNSDSGDTPEDESSSGGSTPDVELTFESVKEVTERYNADFELCRNTEYVNLDWTNAGRCPVYPASELYDIKVGAGSLTNDNGMPIKEVLDKFEEYCKFYFGECLDEYAGFVPQSDKGEEILPDPPGFTVNGIEYRGDYKISDYREKLENRTVWFNFLWYRNIEKNQYLWFAFDEYPHWINKGETLTVLADPTNRCSSWIPSDMGEPIARYYNDGKSDDVKYRLTDGEVSIGEAIKYFTEEYPQALPYEDKPVVSVNFVDVYELSEGIYGYLLGFSQMCETVAIERLGEMTGDRPDYYNEDGQALMIKKNDIDVTYECIPRTLDEREGEPITAIVSLKEAADKVSRTMTQNIKFEVVSTEFIYHGLRDSEGVAHLKPTWRFILYNANDDKHYNVYIDAASGEFRLFSYKAYFYM